MQFTKVEGGYLAGDRRRPMTVPRAPPMIPLLCYEIIFPGDVTPRGERPGWLVNLTNDGWFGISSGPYQHLQQARVRAIEEGLPLVRAANTGISAVVDPLGRIIASLPLGAQGVLDAPLPQPVAPTLYARFGDGLAGLLVAIALVLVGVRRLRDRKGRVAPHLIVSGLRRSSRQLTLRGISRYLSRMVARRHVYHLAGYDPIDAAAFYRRFTRQLDIFRRTWNVNASLSPLERPADQPSASLDGEGGRRLIGRSKPCMRSGCGTTSFTVMRRDRCRCGSTRPP